MMRFKKPLLYLFVFVVSCMIIFLFVRNWLLHYFIDKYAGKYGKQYSALIAISSSSFEGLTGVRLNKVSLVPYQRDTLVYIDSMFFKIRLLPLFSGKFRLNDLELVNSTVNLVKNKHTDNYSFLFKKDSVEKDTTERKLNYAALSNNFLSLLFDLIPSSLNVKNTFIRLNSDSTEAHIKIPEISIQDYYFHTSLQFIDHDTTHTWVSTGNIDSDRRKGDIKLYPSDQQSAAIPFLKKKWNLLICTDTLSLSIEKAGFNEDVLQLKGYAAIQKLEINHEKISPKPVTINKAGFHYICHIGRDYIRLDSSSRSTLNHLVFSLYFKYQLKPGKQLELHINNQETDAGLFFGSLPHGLFRNLEEIKVKGKLRYRLSFFMDQKQPDSLQFHSSLSQKDFKIVQFGNTDLLKINNEFVHTVYEKGSPIKSFTVGTSNPHFTKLDRISPLLKAAVMTSEDGNFYHHKGFNEEMFRRSIAENYRKKRFVRGGSTISMQLVKNVFLTRNKNIARKIEEALLVWLIENEKLVSKDRLLEVYLNIIEWGPGVYGIGEASHFYFNKHPGELNLAESIFLAMIVPRPKSFRNYFDPLGNLKQSTGNYYNLLAKHLCKKGIITEAEKNNLVPIIILNGPVKKHFTSTESLPQEKEIYPHIFEFDQ